MVAKKKTAKKTEKKSPSRARGRASTSTTTSTTKKKTPAKKTSTRPAAKKTATKKTTSRNVKKVTKPQSKRGGATREMDEVTGFAVGTDSQIIAEALIEGGETRQTIIDELKETLEGETRNGTEKPVANLVAGVHNKLIERGFTVEASFRLVPPVKRGRKRKS